MKSRSVWLRACTLISLAAVYTLSGAYPRPPLIPPRLTPFGDAEWWVLTESLPYKIGNSNEVITIPRGFTTDLASTPRFIWSVFQRTGNYMSAAILHDYLYWNQSCPKEQADDIFRIEMSSFGVDQTTTKLIHAAVNDFGGSAWKKNTVDRQRGLPRLIPLENVAKFLSEPLDSSKTWQSLQSNLKVTSLDMVYGRSPSEQAVDLRDTCTRAIQNQRR